ncbi:hypothetical protein DFS34DRAFT_36802 [Phlyctochytrium arcticum]|nr:hypothetical protein DFS34DRAFT_36802 [Phlyctochytrium arcticum]
MIPDKIIHSKPMASLSDVVLPHNSSSSLSPQDSPNSGSPISAQPPTYDPIIAQLLSSRQEMKDVSPEDEQERQRRMYIMLKYSRKYRKIQVEQANEKWGEQNLVNSSGASGVFSGADLEQASSDDYILENAFSDLDQDPINRHEIGSKSQLQHEAIDGELNSDSMFIESSAPFPTSTAGPITGTRQTTGMRSQSSSKGGSRRVSFSSFVTVMRQPNSGTSPKCIGDVAESGESVYMEPSPMSELEGSYMTGPLDSSMDTIAGESSGGQPPRGIYKHIKKASQKAAKLLSLRHS